MASNATNIISSSQIANTTQATNVTLQNTTWWVRVVLAIELCLTDALLHILHNYDNDPTYTGLTDDEVQLYNQMVTFKKTHKKKLCKVIHEDQWNILCPPSGRSDSSTWDITLLIVVIRYYTDLPSPQGTKGWEQKSPQKSDTSKAAFILLSRTYRNDVKHGSIHNISTKAQFTVYWGNMETLLNGLKYTNMALFYDLETGTLKMYTKLMVKVLEDKIADHEYHIDQNEFNIDQNDGEIKSLKNHLFILQSKTDDLTKKMTKIETDVESLKLNKTPPSSTDIYWNVYQNVHNFIDRYEIGDKIETFFTAPNEERDHHISVVIHGLGGVGKTEVSANYAKSHKELYDNIIWFDCENIEDSVKEFSTYLHIGNKEFTIAAHLNAIYTTLKNTKCLFILDNIKDYQDATVFSTSVANFKVKPHFLITTQRSCWDDHKFKEVQLSIFSIKTSVLFLRKEFSSEVEESIIKLSDVLECFPLALQQARAYILKHKMSVDDYIRYFKEENTKILDINLQKFGSSQYKKTLLTVWKIALEKIRSSKYATNILRMMAFMDSKRINKNTFLFHESINQDVTKLNEIIDVLTEYSLIQIQNTKYYTILSMHSLIKIIVKGSDLQDDINHFDATLDLLNNCASFKPRDREHLWYVHIKYILYQIKEMMMNEKLFELTSYAMALAVIHQDNDFATHICSLLINPIVIPENVNVEHLIETLYSASQILFNGGYFVACKNVLDVCFKLLQTNQLKNRKEKYYLECLHYFQKINDVKGMKQSYSMIKDLTFLEFINDVTCDPTFYHKKLIILTDDFCEHQVLMKEKADLMSLVNEPILVLGPLLDTYGYNNNGFAVLYFSCILLKIHLEISDGEDKEEDFQLLKEKLKLNGILEDFFQNLLLDIQCKIFLLNGKIKETLDILQKEKTNLLEEESILFLDSQPLDMIYIDYNIALLMLKLEKYKEAHDGLKVLYDDQPQDWELKCRIKCLYAIAKVLGDDLEYATELLNQIPIKYMDDQYISLNCYLSSYKIQHQKVNELRKATTNNCQQELHALLGECVDLKKSILSLCKHIISNIEILSYG